MGTSLFSSTVTEGKTILQPVKMMKLVVLAMALTAVSAGTTVLSGLPLFSGAIPYAGYGGIPIAAAGGIPFTAGVPVTSHVAAAPVAYRTLAAAPLVAPSPYSVQTGLRTDITYEPVEQHGYVV